MKKTRVNLMLLVLILVALPILGACAQKAAPETPKGEIIFGVLDDLSGPLAGLCTARKDGGVDAIKYINEQKGGILGHPIRVIVIDHKMDTTLMSSGWERLKSEKAVVVSGVTVSMGAVPQLAKKDKIPSIAGQGAGLDALFPKETSYLFSQGAAVPDMVWSACRQIEKDWNAKGGKGTPKVGFDIVNLGIQKTMATKAAKMDMEKRGWQYIITYTSLAPADVTTQVLQMKNFGCDYMFSASAEAAVVAWLKELDRQNFHPVIFGSTNLGSSEIWNATGQLCVGTKPTVNAPQWEETNLPLVSLLHRLYPDVKQRPSNYMSGFATTLVVAEGLKNAATKVGYENLTGDAVQQALDSIRDFDPGIGIGFTWTPTDHQGIHGARWYQWSADGHLAPLMSEWDVFPPMPEEQRTDAWWMK